MTAGAEWREGDDWADRLARGVSAARRGAADAGELPAWLRAGEPAAWDRLAEDAERARAGQAAGAAGLADLMAGVPGAGPVIGRAGLRRFTVLL